MAKGQQQLHHQETSEPSREKVELRNASLIFSQYSRCHSDQPSKMTREMALIGKAALGSYLVDQRHIQFQRHLLQRNGLLHR
jgi:hypothetical protein